MDKIRRVESIGSANIIIYNRYYNIIPIQLQVEFGADRNII